MSRLDNIIKRIKTLDKKEMKKAKLRQDSLTKPMGSLGRLEELSIQIAGITGNLKTKIINKAIIIMAADHGVAKNGVSLFPQDVTQQMITNFLENGAGINVIADHVGARVVVVNIGAAKDVCHHPKLIQKSIDFGTKDMTKGPAMTREQAFLSIEVGIDVVENEIKNGLDIVGTGDMGIGNTTASSAICALLTQSPVSYVTGRGTGLNNKQLLNKISIIEKAININIPDYNDPIDVLSKIGGFEIGGLCGVMLGAAANKIPVVIDGFISGAAALIAAGLCPIIKDYFIPGHVSVEKGHKILLDYLKISPLLNLNMRLGEGTGAALAINLAEASLKILNNMATFEQAKVAKAKQ